MNTITLINMNITLVHMNTRTLVNINNITLVHMNTTRKHEHHYLS